MCPVVDADTMSDDRQPSYDYFTPPRPAEPPEQPVAPPFPGPPRSPYPGSPPGPLRDVVPGHLVPGQIPFADTVPGVRSGMPRWAIALLVTVAALFGLGILAAVAIPVFLSQRLKADFAATSVSLPATFNGVDRNTSAQASTLAQGFAVDDIRVEDVGIYGKVGPAMVVVLAVKPAAAMSSDEQQKQRDDFERGFSAQGTPLSLTGGPEDGDLGGWAGCATTGQKLDVCLATTTGSLVAVISASTGSDPVTLLRQARAATVHHS